VASLIEKSPTDGLLPLQVGAMTLTALPWARITSVAPLAGQAGAVAAALKGMGLGWPAPNTSARNGADAVLWTGRDQAFLIGQDPAPLAGIAALTDQSDGWAVLSLAGEGHVAALARLVAVDMADAAFPPGSVARTGLNHMMAVFHRPDARSVTIMVFRSMAATAVHEIEVAARAVVARQGR
jgi:sarcosine oxidase subunit gamma